MNSMTGFGSARGQVFSSHVMIEVRSVNHRYCEVNCRFQGRWSSLEQEVIQLVKKRFSRGKIDLYLREEGVDRPLQELRMAREAYRVLRQIQRDLGLKGEATLSDLLNFREIYFRQSPPDDTEKVRRPLMGLISKALDGLALMREREGRNLHRWFVRGSKRLHALLTSIERQAKSYGKNYQRRLNEKMKGVVSLEPERVAQEVAIMAARTDITEEIVRLRGHCTEFEKMTSKTIEPIGRKLDFLIQEMGREVNTIGSKSQGVRISHDVISFKTELERIREQVQNIE